MNTDLQQKLDRHPGADAADPAGTARRQWPVSGSALVGLALVLAAVWMLAGFGREGRALNRLLQKVDTDAVSQSAGDAAPSGIGHGRHRPPGTTLPRHVTPQTWQALVPRSLPKPARAETVASTSLVAHTHRVRRTAMSATAAPAVPLAPGAGRQLLALNSAGNGAAWSVFVPMTRARDELPPSASQTAAVPQAAPAALPPGAVAGGEAAQEDPPAPYVFSEDPRVKRCEMGVGVANAADTCRTAKSDQDAGAAYDDCLREFEISLARCIAQR